MKFCFCLTVAIEWFWGDVELSNYVVIINSVDVILVASIRQGWERRGELQP